jgi:ketosteroid isomerase-like protein
VHSRFSASFFAIFEETQFTWSVEPMLDPRRVFAVWTLDILLTDGRRYQNEGASVFQLRRDRIADFTDFFDTAAFLRIVGNQ